MRAFPAFEERMEQAVVEKQQEEEEQQRAEQPKILRVQQQVNAQFFDAKQVVQHPVAKKKDRRAPVQIGERRLAVLTIDAEIEDADHD